MKLTTRARYALRSMVEIARHADEAEPISLENVANATQISRRYLEQLAIALRGASLLRSVSGRRGGYYLSRPPDEIMIGEIVAAAIGSINVVDCVGLPETCLKADTCECRLVYMLINRGIKEVLNRYSLADLSDREWLKTVGKELGLDICGVDTGVESRRRRRNPCPSS
ncbi:MAG: Rrf2 family transcriptional regulator [Phycisphaerae bacterium]|nr:Rrf2 family transcriptional regulator [Phycisphaerae bacterium]